LYSTSVNGITYIGAAGVARRPTARAQLHLQSRPNYISLTLPLSLIRSVANG
jgi:hypothetical protein